MLKGDFSIVHVAIVFRVQSLFQRVELLLQSIELLFHGGVGFFQRFDFGFLCADFYLDVGQSLLHGGLIAHRFQYITGIFQLAQSFFLCLESALVFLHGGFQIMDLLLQLAQLAVILAGIGAIFGVDTLLYGVFGVTEGGLGFLERAAQNVLHIVQDLFNLTAVGLFGIQNLLRQGLVGFQTLQVFHQFVGVTQCIHRAVTGLFLGYAACGQVGVTAEQVFAQLLDQLRLCSAFGGGSQTLGYNIF